MKKYFFLMMIMGVIFHHLNHITPITIAQTPQPPSDLFAQADVTLGAQLYALYCTECHGVNGAGDGEMVQMRRVPYPGNFLDLSQIEGKTPQDYYTIIANGNADETMPAWADVITSDDELWAVTKYVYTLNESTPESTPEATPLVRESVLGAVSGEVTIGTQGLVLPADAEISLHIVDTITQTETIQIATISADNRYAFGDIPITDGDFYFVLMSVNGRNFASNPVVGDVRFPNLDIPITVYDVVTDPTVITIENIVVQIRPTQGVLGFTQVVQVRNQSNRLYIGGIPTVNNLTASFELTLPVGALVMETLVMLNNEIAPTRPSSFVVDNSTFKVQYTEAIFPDLDYLFVISYVMPYEQDAVMEFPLWHRFDGDMRLLIGTDELQVIGNNIESLGAQSVGETSFSAYGASYDLFPNDIIRYELRGRVAGVGEFVNTNTAPQNTISLSDNLPLLLMLGVVGMLVIFLGTTFMSGRRKSKILPTESELGDKDAS